MAVRSLIRPSRSEAATTRAVLGKNQLIHKWYKGSDLVKLTIIIDENDVSNVSIDRDFCQ